MVYQELVPYSAVATSQMPVINALHVAHITTHREIRAAIRGGAKIYYKISNALLYTPQIDVLRAYWCFLLRCTLHCALHVPEMSLQWTRSRQRAVYYLIIL
jgi:hypothetical protein